MGLFSGVFGGGGSAKRAAGVAAQAAENARQNLRKDTEAYQAYYMPYRNAGDTAAAGQNALLGGISNKISALDPKIAALYSEREALNPQIKELYTLSQQQDPVVQEILGGGKNFTADPGYQFRLAEGQKALERSRAAQGILNSGATGKALLEYGQGMGSQEFNNYMNRQYNALNAVQSQLGGRDIALNAGQNQINQGVNLLGQDFNQIMQQQQLAQQYQTLINSGMSAADASARLGLTSSMQQAGYTQDVGNAYASGMQAKDAQMKAAGDQWLNLGTAVLTGGGSMFMPGGGPFNTASTTSGGQPQYSRGGQQLLGSAPAQPYQNSFLGGFYQGFNNPTVNSLRPGVNMNIQGPVQQGYTAQPWINPDIQQAARISSSSSYAQPRYYQ